MVVGTRLTVSSANARSQRRTAAGNGAAGALPTAQVASSVSNTASTSAETWTASGSTKTTAGKLLGCLTAVRAAGESISVHALYARADVK